MKYENKNNHNQKKLFTLIDEHYCDRQWHTFPRFLERAKMTEAARLKKFPIKHWRRQPGIRWPLGPMITDSWMFWLYPKITQRTHTQTQSVRDESHRQNVKEKKTKTKKKAEEKSIFVGTYNFSRWNIFRAFGATRTTCFIYKQICLAKWIFDSIEQKVCAFHLNVTI